MAEWFISLDEEGQAYVETPFYLHHRNLKSSTEIHRDPTHFPTPSSSTDEDLPTLGFVPQRGIGQEESASSLMWVAVYDILLDWIEPSNKLLHPAGYHELRMPTTLSQPLPSQSPLQDCPQISNAYADDLATISTGPLAHIIQQLQAE